MCECRDSLIEVNYLNFNRFKGIFPKIIDISILRIKIDELKAALQLFDTPICYFSLVEVTVQLPRDF